MSLTEYLERLPLEHPSALRFFAVAVVFVVFLTALCLLADRETAADRANRAELEGDLELEEARRA